VSRSWPGVIIVAPGACARGAALRWTSLFSSSRVNMFKCKVLRLGLVFMEEGTKLACCSKYVRVVVQVYWWSSECRESLSLFTKIRAKSLRHRGRSSADSIALPTLSGGEFGVLRLPWAKKVFHTITRGLVFHQPHASHERLKCSTPSWLKHICGSLGSARQVKIIQLAQLD
jgi:hypothetical protein